ncbi:MAG: folate-binding protein YgfZ [Anaerolineales bacterium]|nr:folate-binding protein YgfZ [Anaerolineales bacterium]
MIWVDLSGILGRLRLTDRDRLDLLHRLSTNDLSRLQVGQGCSTVLTTPIARIIDLLVVLNQGDSVWVIANRTPVVENWLRRNIFWNDRLKVENQSDQLQHIGVWGVGDDLGIPADLPLYHTFTSDDGALMVRVPADGYWLIGEPSVIARWIDRLESQGAQAGTLDDVERLRIEAGLPAAGHELTEDYIPLELGLWDAVSFSKGCYTGQEIIARMESRGQLAKMMVKVSLENTTPAGTTLSTTEGKTAGTLTSVATQPDGQIIGLAVVKAAIAESGQPLLTDQAAPVQIVGLAGQYQ